MCSLYQLKAFIGMRAHPTFRFDCHNDVALLVPRIYVSMRGNHLHKVEVPINHWMEVASGSEVDEFMPDFNGFRRNAANHPLAAQSHFQSA
jgi:hypothetical protein